MCVKTHAAVREKGERDEDSGYLNTLGALGWESLPVVTMFTPLQAGNWSGRITSDQL